MIRFVKTRTIVIIVTIVVAGALASAWRALTDAPATATAPPPPAPTEHWLSQTVPRGPAPPPPADLRAQYREVRDKHAFYVAMKDRPEPDAKYLAYRAAKDCQAVLGRHQDIAGSGYPNLGDLDFAFKEALTDTASDRDLDSKRRAAMAGLEAMCGGFTGAERLPKDAELVDLVRTAAKGGSTPAKVADALNMDDPRGMLGRLRTVAGQTFKEADVLALREMTPVLPMAPASMVEGGFIEDLTTRAYAFDLAACMVDDGCGPANQRSLFFCAFLARCPEGGWQQILVEEMTKLDPAAYAIVVRMAAEFRTGEAKLTFQGQQR
jgi:hypothetical protein